MDKRLSNVVEIIEELEKKDCELTLEKANKIQECLSILEELKNVDDSIINIKIETSGLKFSIFVKCDIALRIYGDNKKLWLKAFDLCDLLSVEMLDDIFYLFELDFNSSLLD